MCVQSLPFWEKAFQKLPSRPSSSTQLSFTPQSSGQLLLHYAAWFYNCARHSNQVTWVWWYSARPAAQLRSPIHWNKLLYYYLYYRTSEVVIFIPFTIFVHIFFIQKENSDVNLSILQTHHFQFNRRPLKVFIPAIVSQWRLSSDYEGLIYLICPYDLPWVSPDKMVWATPASWVVWEFRCLLSSCCWMRSGLRSLRSSSALWPSYLAWYLFFFQRHGMWVCQRQLMILKSQRK